MRLAAPLVGLLLTVPVLAACAGTAQPAPASQPAPESAVGLNAEAAEQTIPPPRGPENLFVEGVYVVGRDIVPGTYRTNGPTDDGGSCYWARLSDTTGDFDAVIANGRSSGQITLTVKDSDAAVETSGCAGWLKVD
jgi:hypothetical protein